MKKIALLIVLSLSLNLVAQTSEVTNEKKIQFGITVGYVNATAKATSDNSSVSSSNSDGGFSFGVSLLTELSEKFYLQPSVQCAIVDDENFLFIPVMLKYYVADGFSVMVGPQGSFSFEDKQGLPINTFGLDLSFGAGYDFSDHFYLEARYAFELTNRTPDGIGFEFIENEFDPAIARNVDMKTKLNSFHITLGYRF